MDGEHKYLLIEPFNSGSHKQLIDILLKNIPGTYAVTLAGKKWHWKARTSALYLSQVIPKNCNYKSVFASSVLNLAELVALRPDLVPLHKVVYFHENQLVYPVRKAEERDFQYGYNQILSCQVADTVLFNSEYNKVSFLENISTFLKLIPYERPKNIAGQLRPKCHVLHFPIEFPQRKAVDICNYNSDSCLLYEKTLDEHDHANKDIEETAEVQRSDKTAQEVVREAGTYGIETDMEAVGKEEAIEGSDGLSQAVTAVRKDEHIKSTGSSSNTDTVKKCNTSPSSNQSIEDNCAHSDVPSKPHQIALKGCSDKYVCGRRTVADSQQPSGSTDRILDGSECSSCLPDVESGDRKRFKDGGEMGQDKLECLHIVWPHRWEHDKGPEAFFKVMCRLQEAGLKFRLSVLGEDFLKKPGIFEEVRTRLHDVIEHWGFLPSKEDYYRALSQADCVVSTADHEFFGVAMLEAVHLGCYPLCPNRLVYPEIFPKEYLYNTDNQLFKRLREFCRRPHLVRRHICKVDTSQYGWELLKKAYTKHITGNL